MGYPLWPCNLRIQLATLLIAVSSPAVPPCFCIQGAVIKISAGSRCDGSFCSVCAIRSQNSEEKCPAGGFGTCATIYGCLEDAARVRLG